MIDFSERGRHYLVTEETGRARKMPMSNERHFFPGRWRLGRRAAITLRRVEARESREISRFRHRPALCFAAPVPIERRAIYCVTSHRTATLSALLLLNDAYIAMSRAMPPPPYVELAAGKKPMLGRKRRRIRGRHSPLEEAEVGQRASFI